MNCPVVIFHECYSFIVIGRTGVAECVITIAIPGELIADPPLSTSIGRVLVQPDHSWEELGGMVVLCLENHLRPVPLS